jgi:hypothetical protein
MHTLAPARLIQEVSGVTLTDAIDKMWVSTYGPPKDLCVVGEAGTTIPQNVYQYSHHNGITLHQRTRDRHARPTERRGLLLKATIHRIITQLHVEDLAHLPYETILGEAVRCINAVLSTRDVKVGPSDWLTTGWSNQRAGVHGRAPPLRQTGGQAAQSDERRQPALKTACSVQRLRVLTFQAVVGIGTITTQPNYDQTYHLPGSVSPPTNW